MSHQEPHPSGVPASDQRLESWGEIASYLTRSVSTVQRWEKREGLPIHRHGHQKLDSVYAYKHEIDAWRDSRHVPNEESGLQNVIPNYLAPVGHEQINSHDFGKEPSPSVPIWWSVALVVSAVSLGVSLRLTLYGVAILAFCLSTIFVALAYRCLKDTSFARAGFAVFMLAAMSFIPSAWTLQEVMSTAVNIETLPPAVVYPFITGLQFIPLFILIFGYWVILGLTGDVGFLKKPHLGKTYILLGLVFLLATGLAIASHSDDYRIWTAGLPGRWIILIAYAIVFAINITIWLLGYRALNTDAIASYRGLFSRCAIAYLFVTVPAVLIGHQYNEINKHYLDKRRSDVYRITNPDAIEDFHNPRDRSQIGPDLTSLLKDPEFAHAIRNKNFYKQNFDEPFQVLSKAVLFGYQIEPISPGKKPIFLIIRFPEELARALRFQFIGKEESWGR